MPVRYTLNLVFWTHNFTICIRFSFNINIIAVTGITHFQSANIFLSSNINASIINAVLCINPARITNIAYKKYFFLSSKNGYATTIKLTARYCLTIFSESKKKPPKKKIKILNIGYLDLVIIVYIISPTVIAEVTINNAVDSCENNKHILIIVLNPISIFFTSIPFAILW